MRLQRENKFKKGVFSLIAGAATFGVVFTLLGGTSDLQKLLNQKEGMKEQTELVESAVNKEYISNENSEEITEYIPKYDFDSLREINPKITGIIEGDIFEGGYYPVVSSDSFEEVNDNLVHSIDGSYNTIGTITEDPYNVDNMQGNITRIWGHHFAGEEENGKMFSSLVNYDNQDFYNEHKSLKYYTDSGEYDLEIFACTKDNPLDQNIGVDDDLTDDIDDIKSRSYITSDITPDDRMMILTTCTRDGSAGDPYNRISVYAKINPVYELNNTKTR